MSIAIQLLVRPPSHSKLDHPGRRMRVASLTTARRRVCVCTCSMSGVFSWTSLIIASESLNGSLPTRVSGCWLYAQQRSHAYCPPHSRTCQQYLSCTCQQRVLTCTHLTTICRELLMLSSLFDLLNNSQKPIIFDTLTNGTVGAPVTALTVCVCIGVYVCVCVK